MIGRRLFPRSRFQLFSLFFISSLITLSLSACTRPEQPEAPPPSPPPLSKLEIKPLEAPLQVGESKPLSITALDINQQERKDPAVTWSSENPAIATVGPQGIVTAVAPGSAAVTASGEGLSASVQVEVKNPPVSQLEIQPSTAALTVGDHQPFQAVAKDATGREIKSMPTLWKSKTPSIASVDETGRVTALAPGTATIVATVEDKTVSVRVAVTEPRPAKPAKLEIRPEKASGVAGDALQFEVVIVDAKGKKRTGADVVWKSDNPSISTVNAKGLASLLHAGTVTITASVEGRKASAVLTVTNPPLAKIEVRPAAASIRAGEIQQFEAVVLDSKNRERKELSVVWQTSNASVAGVSSTGLVTARTGGTALITASVAGITSSPVSITVRDKEPAASRPSNEELKAKYKNVDPSQLVYLSGITGEIAGTGDPTKFSGEAEQAGLSQHPVALELSELPKDRYGLVDWATAIKTGKVKPRHSLDPKAPPDEVPLQLDVVIFTKSQFQPDVIFPHFVHTLWLTCANCHPSIFPMNAKEANKMMTMPRIAAGEFCGRCHNRVAFPLSDCLRCHVKPKDTPPIDPNYQAVTKGKKP